MKLLPNLSLVVVALIVSANCNSSSNSRSDSKSSEKSSEKSNESGGKRPNIVIIMADDMGSYDASYRGSNQVLTPNIDALAFNGVSFDRFYTHQMCSPSRSSVMTGKYAHNVGMQTWVIVAGEAWGLGLDEKLMSNYFQDAGYNTHLVGKWHLGYFQRKYTPNVRGFDSFFGYLNGQIDYYNYTVSQPPYNGYDFRNNFDVYYNVTPGAYATDVYTDEAVRIIKNHDKEPFFMMINHAAPHDPNEAPAEEIAKFTHITDPVRRVQAAMISKLDEGIGKVVEALKDSKALKDTIILFYSDNGAPTIAGNAGSNYPLRGQKRGPWEGASRNLGLIYSPLIKKSKRIFDGYFHTADVLPTLASAAGIQIASVEGIDQWHALKHGGSSSRTKSVNSLDNVLGFSAIISDQWKFINGTNEKGIYDGYLGGIQEVSLSPSSYASAVLSSRAAKAIAVSGGHSKLTATQISNLRQKLVISCNEAENPLTSCSPLIAPCLFNIIQDPCERNNLASLHPEIVTEMRQQLNDYLATAEPARRTGVKDPASNPALHGGVWTWWIPDSAY